MFIESMCCIFSAGGLRADMDQHKRLRMCVVASVVLTAMVMVCVGIFGENGSSWLQVGWSATLVVAGVAISSPARYAAMILLVLVLKISETLINEFAGPILGFTIYNPDKKNIPNFSKAGLQIAANTIWLLSGLRSVFYTVIIVSQIDFAIIAVLGSEVTAFFTIRVLLNEKTFNADDDDADTHALLVNADVCPVTK